MKRAGGSLLSLLLLTLVVNCSLEVPIGEFNLIKEVQIMELQPIEEFTNYIAQESGKVLGIMGNETKEVILQDIDDKKYQFADFFIDNGLIYFTIELPEQGDAIPETDPVQYETILKPYYFTQIKGVLEEIQEEDYPEKPILGYIEMNKAPFKITKSAYKDLDISEVYQGTTKTAYKQIDSYVKNDVGLWFSVLESFSTRLKGIYFYGNGANIIRVKEEGRIW